jgi:hypothetical protein
MSQFYCDQEREVIEALRCGSLNAALQRHASSCAICSDTVVVSEFLQSDLAEASLLPNSDYIWWMGQLASKQMAVRRATRSIAQVRSVSYLGLTAAALCLILTPGNLQSILGAFSGHRIWSIGGLAESALLMGIGALFFALLGSLYFAWSEK